MTQLSVFESRTPEVIKAEILTALTASGVEIDTREGSYTNTLISQISYALWQHSQLLSGLLPIVFPGPDRSDLHWNQWHHDSCRNSGICPRQRPAVSDPGGRHHHG